MIHKAFGIATVVVVALISGFASPSDEPDRLQNLQSWSETRAAAQRLNVPIVLLVEQRHCAFCQRLKRDLFRPLANDPAYFDRVLFASVLTDFDGPDVERNGKKVSGFEFAENFDASTTPTVLFLDHASNELQTRIVGYIADADYKLKFIRKVEKSIQAAASDD